MASSKPALAIRFSRSLLLKLSCSRRAALVASALDHAASSTFFSGNRNSDRHFIILTCWGDCDCGFHDVRACELSFFLLIVLMTIIGFFGGAAGRARASMLSIFLCRLSSASDVHGVRQVVGPVPRRTLVAATFCPVRILIGFRCVETPSTSVTAPLFAGHDWCADDRRAEDGALLCPAEHCTLEGLRTAPDVAGLCIAPYAAWMGVISRDRSGRAMGFTIIAARIPRSSEPLAPLFAPMRNSPVTGPVSAAADELLQTTKIFD